MIATSIQATARDRVRNAVASVADPEIPMLTIEDLGILRDLTFDGDRAVVAITPTYAGCPAMDVIRARVRRAAHAAGAADVEVATVLAPAWSTDDITDAGRAKLAAAGIAPPSPVRPHGSVPVALTRRPPPAGSVPNSVTGSAEHPVAPYPVACPNCGAAETVELSRFGSTACKALRRCTACGEPFEQIKAL